MATPEPEKTEYRITLIPIPLDGPVLYHGKEYTTAAKRYHIELDGRSFYFRADGGEGLLKDTVEASLEQIVRMIKPSTPLTISLSLEQE